MSKKVVTIKIKRRLLNKLQELASSILKVKRVDHAEPFLGEIFIWQETKKYADEQLKASWKAAVEENIISDDDYLRNYGERGVEENITKSKSFTFVVKTQKPRLIFSREKFILALSDELGLDMNRLLTIADRCTEETSVVLYKRVVEN
jgi:hypothetical protein